MIGIITYHSAYNYGSVLQAYALLKKIDEIIDDEVEVINYIPYEQKNFYCLYRSKYGLKQLLKDLMLLPVHFKRICKEKKFDRFIRENISSKKAIHDINDLVSEYDIYNTLISGSDQIWNKHSNELEHSSWESMYPYLCKDFKGLKYSYASSIGNMSKDELARIQSELDQFDRISVREQSSINKIRELIDKDVKCVVDPTLLFDKREWIDMMELNENHDREYLVYYSLVSYKKVYSTLPYIEKFAFEKGYKIKILTPFVYYPCINSKILENCHDCGPIDFMNLILNASYVITDSYHGMLFSLNFNKEFVTFGYGNVLDSRKLDILERLGLKHRYIENIEKLDQLSSERINYDIINEKISYFRDDSISYLLQCLYNNGL